MTITKIMTWALNFILVLFVFILKPISINANTDVILKRSQDDVVIQRAGERRGITDWISWAWEYFTKGINNTNKSYVFEKRAIQNTKQLLNSTWILLKHTKIKMTQFWKTQIDFFSLDFATIFFKYLTALKLRYSNKKVNKSKLMLNIVDKSQRILGRALSNNITFKTKHCLVKKPGLLGSNHMFQHILEVERKKVREKVLGQVCQRMPVCREDKKCPFLDFLESMLKVFEEVEEDQFLEGFLALTSTLRQPIYGDAFDLDTLCGIEKFTYWMESEDCNQRLFFDKLIELLHTRKIYFDGWDKKKTIRENDFSMFMMELDKIPATDEDRFVWKSELFLMDKWVKKIGRGRSKVHVDTVISRVLEYIRTRLYSLPNSMIYHLVDNIGDRKSVV